MKFCASNFQNSSLGLTKLYRVNQQKHNISMEVCSFQKFNVDSKLYEYSIRLVISKIPHGFDSNSELKICFKRLGEKHKGNRVCLNVKVVVKKNWFFALLISKTKKPTKLRNTSASKIKNGLTNNLLPSMIIDFR